MSKAILKHWILKILKILEEYNYNTTIVFSILTVLEEGLNIYIVKNVKNFLEQYSEVGITRCSSKDLFFQFIIYSSIH